MLRYMATLDPLHRAVVPPRSRPLVRYRREGFGWLAGFPDGRIALLGPAAGPALARGASYEECACYLLTRLEVDRGFHFSAPVMSWLEITRQCNLRCPHCFVEGGVKRASELDTPRIMRLLEEWAESGVFCVIITGGEPGIHPDFIEIVNHAHALGFVVGIATNGMTMTPARLEKLPRHDVVISVSIDGIHGQGLSRGESDFTYATRRLLEISEAGFNTSIMTTTHRHNVHDQLTILQWARDHGVALRSVPFVSMGRGARHRDLENESFDAEAAARFWVEEEQWERDHDGVLGLSAGRIFSFLLTMVYAMRRCMSGRGLCYINSSGDVYPCSTCAGNQVLCAGNVQMDPFARIWGEDWDIRRVTWDTYERECRNCPLNEEKYFCTSRCPGSSSVLHGRFDGCGATEFQKESTLLREALFRERIMSEPVVRVGTRTGHEAERDP
jgi:radical SAM protein with 4Fe4S-binding SPASM domain